ncbi:hypothetical protein [Candidatus Nanohalococcus occultus]|uniref:hypothetical protein n=1 Tax=Candidatus Nanohalococcus occultus TaxID=2978047 RepID=UPI0039E084D0
MNKEQEIAELKQRVSNLENLVVKLANEVGDNRRDVEQIEMDKLGDDVFDNDIL